MDMTQLKFKVNDKNLVPFRTYIPSELDINPKLIVNQLLQKKEVFQTLTKIQDINKTIELYYVVMVVGYYVFACITTYAIDTLYGLAGLTLVPLLYIIPKFNVKKQYKKLLNKELTMIKPIKVKFRITDKLGLIFAIGMSIIGAILFLIEIYMLYVK